MSEDVGFVTMGQSSGRKDVPVIGVGMLGYAFMGKAHSNALRKIPYMVDPLPAVPALVAICGRNEAAVRDAAARYGFPALLHRLARTHPRMTLSSYSTTAARTTPTLSLASPPPRPASTLFAKSPWRVRPKSPRACWMPLTKPESSTRAPTTTALCQPCGWRGK